MNKMLSQQNRMKNGMYVYFCVCVYKVYTHTQKYIFICKMYIICRNYNIISIKYVGKNTRKKYDKLLTL